MQVMFKFKLPQEQEECKIFENAQNMYCFVCDFSNFLREKLKYGNLTEDESRIYEILSNKFWELLNENEINILF
jgi:hypothetical protein